MLFAQPYNNGKRGSMRNAGRAREVWEQKLKRWNSNKRWRMISAGQRSCAFAAGKIVSDQIEEGKAVGKGRVKSCLVYNQKSDSLNLSDNRRNPWYFINHLKVSLFHDHRGTIRCLTNNLQCQRHVIQHRRVLVRLAGVAGDTKRWGGARNDRLLISWDSQLDNRAAKSLTALLVLPGKTNRAIMDITALLLQYYAIWLWPWSLDQPCDYVPDWAHLSL